jgi:xanthine dehydrogenase accessory factor
MFDEFFSIAAELAKTATPFATAIVVRAEKPTSGKPGDKAIVTADGVLHGWIGGSCAQPTVVKMARQAMQDGEPRLIRLSANPDAMTARDGLIELPMTCYSGGALEIYIEPQLPRPRLLIVGALPTARALARLGCAMNYQVFVVDPETTGAGLPAGVEVITDLERMTHPINSLTYVVVASHGAFDEMALEHALRSNAAYVGLVASQRRAAAVRHYLAARGIDAARLALLKCPAGLDIGARRGDEIALSIIAEIVHLRRNAEKLDFAALLNETTPASTSGDAPQTPATQDPPSAIDPVCKMEVAVARAQYTSAYAGKHYFFCCAGCKLAFDQAPENYVTVINLETLLE